MRTAVAFFAGPMSFPSISQLTLLSH